MWNELVTSDRDACREFYGALLGWTTKEMPMPEGAGPGAYTIWVAGNTDAGGMFKLDENHMGEKMPSHWMAYVSVADVDATAAKVENLGGQIRVPPRDIPGVGRFCVITDPTGAWVSLMTMAEGT
ncbi:MAG: VOC family protein [Rhodospirillales bacterium]|jgi:hypothetical protein|nr:VOC family protein [Rhodospirillales bacterium]